MFFRNSRFFCAVNNVGTVIANPTKPHVQLIEADM